MSLNSLKLIVKFTFGSDKVLNFYLLRSSVASCVSINVASKKVNLLAVTRKRDSYLRRVATERSSTSKFPTSLIGMPYLHI